MVLNQAPRLPDDAARKEIDRELGRQEIQQHAIVPYDDQLRVMLDSATYDLAALGRETRMSIKNLGRCAVEWLV